MGNHNRYREPAISGLASEMNSGSAVMSKVLTVEMTYNKMLCVCGAVVDRLLCC